MEAELLIHYHFRSPIHLTFLTVYVPKKGKPVSILNPEEAFNIKAIRPAGVFAIQQDFDSKFVLVPMRFASEIIGADTRVSALEIGLKEGADEEQVRA